MRIVGLLALLGAPTVASASCESFVRQVNGVGASALPGLFTKLARCDQRLAEDRFSDFMRASGDVGTLVSLSLAAIDSGVNAPVWGMLEEIPEFSLRDEVAKGVGAHCVDHPQVLAFLKGAHGQLRDRQFGMWREAFKSCESADLDVWLEQVVSQPPSVSYDEKYNVVSESLIKRQRVASLGVLKTAAIAAGNNGGPFSTILDRMNESVRPDTFGADIAEDDREALEAALVDVAKQVTPELAAQVADRLYQAGAESAAASLLPTIYAGRVQGKGMLTYAVASVETCGKDAIIHYAAVTEPAKRWSIVDDVTPLALAFKPKLKCTSEEAWPVLTTPEPVAGRGEISDWVATIEAEWEEKNLSVKGREEKTIILD